MAIAAYCSAVGRSVTAVSAISTVWLRPTMTLTPNGVAPGSSSITVRTCRSDWLNGRVVPVIIASASPSASIAAAKIVAVLVDHPLDLAAEHAVPLVLLRR